MGDCDELLLVFVENQSPVANYTKSFVQTQPEKVSLLGSNDKVVIMSRGKEGF